MSTDPLASRRAAFDLLREVLGRKHALDTALENVTSFTDLPARERAFARQLITTVLRRLGQIDALIDGALERPLPTRAKGTRDLLRLGLAQLLFMRTADHAAVDTTVDLAQQTGNGPHKRLINAVLRRLGRDGANLVKQQDACRLNTPEWLWASWSAAYGEETCRRIAEAHMDEPPLDLSLKPGAEDWEGALGGRRLFGQTVRLDEGGRIQDLPGYGEGAWWVQDAAAALVCGLFGDVAGRAVIDLCAAPGGKTAALASGGARVIAVDRSKNRMRRLEENMQRLGLSVETAVADANAWRPDAPADAVLVDAPCSATGTLRRHPDIAYLKNAEDITKLADLQARLLRASAEMVKPGGEVVFATCSLQSEDGPAIVEAVLKSGAPLERAAISTDQAAGLAATVDEDGALRTLPCHLGEAGGMDGFYAARLRRI